MSNRQIAYIVKDQKPIILTDEESVRNACRCMWERRSGSVLVVDTRQLLTGILTGRDAVRLLAKAKDAGGTRLAKAMTRNPVTVAPKGRAIDALRAMNNGGFRHVPVTEDGYSQGGCFACRSEGHGTRGISLARKRSTVWFGANLPRYWTYHRRSEASRPWRRRDRSARMPPDAEAKDRIRPRRRSSAAAVGHIHRSGCGARTCHGRRCWRDPTCRGDDENARAITPKNSAVDALRSMNDGGFRHLPVVAERKILGVVSRSDFTGLEIDRLDEDEHLKEVIW